MLCATRVKALLTTACNFAHLLLRKHKTGVMSYATRVEALLTLASEDSYGSWLTYAVRAQTKKTLFSTAISYLANQYSLT